MSNLQTRGKQVLTVAIVLGLLVLAGFMWATAAQGMARFLTTPVGYAPGSTRVPARQAVQDRIPAPPKPVQKALRQPTRLPVARPAGGCYAEPGTPPHSVMMRESGGNPRVYNRTGSGASGCWQFMPGTWDNYKGYANAADAPVSVQNEKAKQVYAGGAGRSHWRQTHP